MVWAACRKPLARSVNFSRSMICPHIDRALRPVHGSGTPFAREYLGARRPEASVRRGQKAWGTGHAHEARPVGFGGFGGAVYLFAGVCEGPVATATATAALVT